MSGEHTCYTCGRLAGTEHTETCPRRAWGAVVLVEQTMFDWRPTHEEEAERIGRNARAALVSMDIGLWREVADVVNGLIERALDGTGIRYRIGGELLLNELSGRMQLVPVAPHHVAMLSSCPGCGKPIGGVQPVVVGCAYVCGRCAATWLCSGVERGVASWCRHDAPADVVEAARQLDERAGIAGMFEADRGAAEGGLRRESEGDRP